MHCFAAWHCSESSTEPRNGVWSPLWIQDVFPCFLVEGHCTTLSFQLFSGRRNAIWIRVHIPKSIPNQRLHDWRYITIKAQPQHLESIELTISRKKFQRWQNAGSQPYTTSSSKRVSSLGKDLQKYIRMPKNSTNSSEFWQEHQLV